MSAWGYRLVFALRYFTRLNFPIKARMRAGDLGRSCIIFPLVGALEGIFVAVLAYIGMMVLNGYFVALFALVARMLIGRGKVKASAHAIDALGSSRSRVRTIQIMFDDHYGTLGMATFLFDFLIKFALYWQIFSMMSFETGIFIVISSCIGPKLALVAGASTSNSVFGKDQLIDTSSIGDLIGCAILTFFFSFLMLGWMSAILLLVLEIALGLTISGMIVMKLGGLTKQTLGLICEIAEIVTLYILLIW